jgi:ribosome-binding protein aMBF1 (putative translation factor)
MTLTGAQVREARELLGWSRIRLAHAAKVSQTSIRKAESDGPRMTDWVQLAIRQALEAAGVAFGENGRVTMREIKNFR